MQWSAWIVSNWRDINNDLCCITSSDPVLRCAHAVASSNYDGKEEASEMLHVPIVSYIWATGRASNDGPLLQLRLQRGVAHNRGPWSLGTPGSRHASVTERLNCFARSITATNAYAIASKRRPSEWAPADSIGKKSTTGFWQQTSLEDVISSTNVTPRLDDQSSGFPTHTLLLTNELGVMFVVVWAHPADQTMDPSNFVANAMAAQRQCWLPWRWVWSKWQKMALNPKFLKFWMRSLKIL